VNKVLVRKTYIAGPQAHANGVGDYRRDPPPRTRERVEADTNEVRRLKRKDRRFWHGQSGSEMARHGR
jgi:hypothetical protein